MASFFVLPAQHLLLKPPFLPNPSLSPLLSVPPSFSAKPIYPFRKKRDFRVFSDDGDADGGGGDYEMDDEEVEEVDNKKDFDVEYEPLGVGGGDEVIQVVQSKTFVSTQGWDSELVVDYRINEEEFHKICLFDCDFFIRKPPDPDNDVFDFREMYVTPPDTDVYSIPKVLAPMPDKYIRCAKSDYGCYNVTEPPIDAPRDPMYKSDREISKVFLTKHYRNRRLNDPEFVLDFEEIYVIDSRTKSITRAKVLVTVPGGRSRDRKADLLVIRDNGNSFKIIHASEREDPTTVIEKEEWTRSRQEMERHLRKLRDFSISNWI
ncbi:PLASTID TRANSCRIPTIONALLY ACTIVE protein 6, chloroplastic [Amaranthus tricolor]|uniref:PLASTID TRANSCRIPTIONALLY ACTIVE protein 6, chloroplastic n=1 Tax=Amaranthus tricolor TaxID=29722 RepID=UPI00258F5F1E|nr:PLASTID TRANSCRIPTIONALLY ACTIVE protein 6, chloroplastic [Amaranthus tricolor]